jgi:hypothetical protein
MVQILETKQLALAFLVHCDTDNSRHGYRMLRPSQLDDLHRGAPTARRAWRRDIRVRHAELETAARGSLPVFGRILIQGVQLNDRSGDAGSYSQRT